MNVASVGPDLSPCPTYIVPELKNIVGLYNELGKAEKYIYAPLIVYTVDAVVNPIKLVLLTLLEYVSVVDLYGITDELFIVIDDATFKEPNILLF